MLDSSLDGDDESACEADRVPAVSVRVRLLVTRESDSAAVTVRVTVIVGAGPEFVSAALSVSDKVSLVLCEMDFSRDPREYDLVLSRSVRDSVTVVSFAERVNVPDKLEEWDCDVVALDTFDVERDPVFGSVSVNVDDIDKGGCDGEPVPEIVCVSVPLCVGRGKLTEPVFDPCDVSVPEADLVPVSVRSAMTVSLGMKSGVMVGVTVRVEVESAVSLRAVGESVDDRALVADELLDTFCDSLSVKFPPVTDSRIVGVDVVPSLSVGDTVSFPRLREADACRDAELRNVKVFVAARPLGVKLIVLDSDADRVAVLVSVMLSLATVSERDAVDLLDAV